MRRSVLKTCSALVAAAMLLQPITAFRASAQTVVAQPNATGVYGTYFRDPASDPRITQQQLIQLIRHRVKYVFVLFQENRSFDSQYGSFPGVRGLFSQSPANTPGFVQPITNVDGTAGTIQPFYMGEAIHAADTDDVDHSHARMAAKMDLNASGIPQMDRFALVEEAKYIPSGATVPPLKAKQYGELAMGYIDCNTIPLMWNFAARFTMFDNMFQHTIGPSTPGALSMIAGQTGETQWVKHPSLASNLSANAANGGLPQTNDSIPFWGTGLAGDNSPQPRHAGDNSGAFAPIFNHTYASLPLTLAGKTLTSVASADTNASVDLADVQQDVPYITGLNRNPYPWGWFEEGYDLEPTDTGTTASHSSYISHHNGPQYFGYISNNPTMTASLHGLGDFFSSMSANGLPSQGGVYYVRGGYKNIAGLTPTFQDPAVQSHFLGDDDHPGYSDTQISENLVAREVNAIAASPYWGESAIIITYDESEGDYDHVAPTIITYDPSGLPLVRGPRVPLILISPFARAHAISHEQSDHNSVIKLVNAVFNLPPLADLPDELQAKITGQQAPFNQQYLGPNDDGTPGVGNLLSGFDPNRLLGYAAPIPASYATTPANSVSHLPAVSGDSCTSLGITPTDISTGYNYPAPADFNPRPSTNPSP